ncbi:hypothetical protein ISN45_At05g048270 [Arabidopsis thaliana x Arabidopsis arenosa]|uniref:HMA domain-containing protein n=3 Tax=Arabidopsis TaxID=3701 RepID=A0A178USF6_ARATH|nr:hypothetical protein ISN45_At05g048270 [Arabidopsis thaliana x Arabidopsis arenosa]KAG7612773.1 hypothetical protein ISN44_As05g047570 [Arabidopsis suecica]OAO96420.1 hypothetical protein AXX17_AT5G51640 [Arabidopsis thaliana]
MAAKKAVLQLGIPEEKIRMKVFVTVAGFTGVTSITIDDKTGKLTVVGDIDVPIIVMKLRKLCKTEIISVDAVKPPEKKPEPEKPAPPKPSEKIASPVPMNLAERVQSCLCLFF